MIGELVDAVWTRNNRKPREPFGSMRKSKAYAAGRGGGKSFPRAIWNEEALAKFAEDICGGIGDDS